LYNQRKGTTQQTEGKVNNRESRDTVNIGHKTSEDKQNKNTIQKTEVAINNKESRDTGNIGHTLCPLLPVSLDSLLLTFPSVCCVVPLL
jgi:hypothetical protein